MSLLIFVSSVSPLSTDHLLMATCPLMSPGRLVSHVTSHQPPLRSNSYHHIMLALSRLVLAAIFPSSCLCFKPITVSEQRDSRLDGLQEPGDAKQGLDSEGVCPPGAGSADLPHVPPGLRHCPGMGEYSSKCAKGGEGWSHYKEFWLK